jgi:hypothetical protein
MMEKISLNSVEIANWELVSLLRVFFCFFLFFEIFSGGFANKILVFHEFGGASAGFDDFLVLFLSAFSRFAGFIVKFFRRILVTMRVFGFIHFFEVFDGKSFDFFG